MSQSTPHRSHALPRAVRRVLVVLAAALVVLVLALTQADGAVANVAFWLALIAWVGIVVRVDRALQGLPERPDGSLDERELALRNATYHRAYRIVSGLGIALLVAAVVGTELAARGAPGFDLAASLLLLFVGYVAVVLNLPWMALAWRLPDPLGEVDG